MSNRVEQMVNFRLFHMPCCKHLLCWINSRLPNFCPECGKPCYMKLKDGLNTQFRDEQAILKTGRY